MRKPAGAAIRILIAFACVSSGAVILSGPSSAAVDPCATPDANVHAGKLDDALPQYESLGKAPCAADGIKALQVRRGAAQRLAGNAVTALSEGTKESVAEAERLAGLALALDSGNTTAADVVQQAKAGAATATDPPLCVEAKRRQDAGDLDTAERIYTSAKDDEASKKCAALGLDQVAAARDQRLPKRIVGALTGTALNWFLFALIAGLVALVIAMSIGNVANPIRTARRWRSKRTRFAVVGLAALSGGATGFFAVLLVGKALDRSWGPYDSLSFNQRGIALIVASFVFAAMYGTLNVIRPRLVLKAFSSTKDYDASDVAALVSATIAKLSTGTAGGVDQVRNTDLVDASFAKVFDLVKNPVASTLTTVWRLLTPGIDLALSAHLHSSSDGSLVAAVVLRHSNHTISSELIDLKALTGLKKADDPQDLATAIAAWVTIQLEVGSKRLYGVTQWKSLALTTIAARRRTTDPEVRPLLARAITIDSQNQAACFASLAAQLRVTTAVVDYEGLVKDLATLRTLVDGQFGDLPLRWRIGYTYIAAHANYLQAVLVSGKDGTPADREKDREAVRTAMAIGSPLRQEMAGLKTKLASITDPSDTAHPDRTLALNLMDALTSADLAIFMIKAYADGSPSLATKVEKVLNAKISVNPRDQYNRACALGAAITLSRLQDPAPDPDPTKDWLLQARGALRAASENPVFAEMATTDPYLRDVRKRAKKPKPKPAPPRTLASFVGDFIADVKKHLDELRNDSDADQDVDS